jgi:putative ABC transport system ATP-binding protein
MTELKIKDLTVEYARGDYIVRPIDSLNLTASTGELVLLLGPSGCGKTTLLSCLAGILSPQSGTIHVGDTSVTELEGDALGTYRRHTVGICFQAFNLISSLTALENVAAPLRAAGISHHESKQRATKLLETVSLGERMHHKPGDLSGGQQQRVAIARALAWDPPLLLADEPTAHLDYVQVESILRLIRELATPGRLVVIATHDYRIVPLADRVIDMAPQLNSEQPERRIGFESGEIIFLQGSRGDLIYIVEQGEVEIVRQRADGGEEIVATVGPGEYFGELGPLLGFPRAATARARATTVLDSYSVHDFRQLLGDDPRVGKLLGTAAKAKLLRSSKGKKKLRRLSPPAHVKRPAPKTPARAAKRK